MPGRRASRRTSYVPKRPTLQDGAAFLVGVTFGSMLVSWCFTAAFPGAFGVALTMSLLWVASAIFFIWTRESFGRH